MNHTESSKYLSYINNRRYITEATVIVCLGVFVLTLFSFIGCNSSPSGIVEKSDSKVIESDGSNESESIGLYDESNSKLTNWDDLPDEMKNAKNITITDENESLNKTKYSNYAYYVGSWGGGGGGYFDVRPPAGSTIYAMGIRSGSLVDRLYVWYKKSDGTIYLGCDRGGNGGGFYMQFFSPGEYIKAISGRSGKYVDRITVQTNIKTFSYGGNGGSEFSVALPTNYQLLGFSGRSGAYIDKIGFHVYTR